jgi:hypothetical protein
MVEHPELLRVMLYAADVGVRAEQDVLKRGFLLVNLFHCFGGFDHLLIL